MSRKMTSGSPFCRKARASMPLSKTPSSRMNGSRCRYPRMRSCARGSSSMMIQSIRMAGEDEGGLIGFGAGLHLEGMPSGIQEHQSFPDEAVTQAAGGVFCLIRFPLVPVLTVEPDPVPVQLKADTDGILRALFGMFKSILDDRKEEHGFDHPPVGLAFYRIVDRFGMRR